MKKSLGLIRKGSKQSIQSQYDRWDRISESTDKLSKLNQAMRMKEMLKEEAKLLEALSNH